MSASVPIASIHVEGVLGAMIRRGFGWGAGKMAARWAGVSPRTIEAAIQGRYELGTHKLFRMLRHSGFRAEMRAYLDRLEQQEADDLLEIQLDAAQRGGVTARDHIERFERCRQATAAGCARLPLPDAPPARLRRA